MQIPHVIELEIVNEWVMMFAYGELDYDGLWERLESLFGLSVSLVDGDPVFKHVDGCPAVTL
jgi:hypothetical protein